MLMLLLMLWYFQEVCETPVLSYTPGSSIEANSVSVPTVKWDMFHMLKVQLLSIPVNRTSLLGWRTSSLVSAETLAKFAPLATDLYYSQSMLRLVGEATGLVKLTPLPLTHPLSCCLLRYDSAGDHITWHKDVNYYQGSTVTVLMTIINRNAFGQCCSANQNCTLVDGREVCIDTLENSCTILKGSEVVHSTRKLKPGEVRIVLSMVFCTDSRQSRWQTWVATLKDWSFLR